MKKLNVFYAHRTGGDDHAKLGRALGSIQERLTKRIGECSVVGTYGRDDWQNYFHGDWDAWAKGVPLRKHAITGKRLYDLFICPDLTIGRATASVLGECLRHGRTVLYYDGEQERFLNVYTVECVDDTDWASGYRLNTTAPTPMEIP
jgi:hypothetical protein